MKTWIIALAIAFIVFGLVANGIKNYIKNDEHARIDYYFNHGATKLGIWYALFHILWIIALSADGILLLIFLLSIL